MFSVSNNSVFFIFYVEFSVYFCYLPAGEWMEFGISHSSASWSERSVTQRLLGLCKLTPRHISRHKKETEYKTFLLVYKADSCSEDGRQ